MNKYYLGLISLLLIVTTVQSSEVHDDFWDSDGNQVKYMSLEEIEQQLDKGIAAEEQQNNNVDTTDDVNLNAIPSTDHIENIQMPDPINEQYIKEQEELAKQQELERLQQLKLKEEQELQQQQELQREQEKQREQEIQKEQEILKQQEIQREQELLREQQEQALKQEELRQQQLQQEQQEQQEQELKAERLKEQQQQELLAQQEQERQQQQKIFEEQQQFELEQQRLQQQKQEQEQEYERLKVLTAQQYNQQQHQQVSIFQQILNELPFYQDVIYIQNEYFNGYPLIEYGVSSYITFLVVYFLQGILFGKSTKHPFQCKIQSVNQQASMSQPNNNNTNVELFDTINRQNKTIEQLQQQLTTTNQKLDKMGSKQQALEKQLIEMQKTVLELLSKKKPYPQRPTQAVTARSLNESNNSIKETARNGTTPDQGTIEQEFKTELNTDPNPAQEQSIPPQMQPIQQQIQPPQRPVTPTLPRRLPPQVRQPNAQKS